MDDGWVEFAMIAAAAALMIVGTLAMVALFIAGIVHLLRGIIW